MNPWLIDSHSHLHLPAYKEDREEVILRLQKENIWTITIGTSINISREAIKLADNTEGVWATAAYHPEHLTSTWEDSSEGSFEEYSFTGLEEVARSSKKIVAIGETGLDFFRFDDGLDVEKAKNLQLNVFRDHLALARKLDLPLVIHCRNAMPEIINILQTESSTNVLKGVIHFFTGTLEEAKALLDLGFYLGFNGAITFPVKKSQDPATHIYRVIEKIPLNRILIETDAPWLAPQEFRGQRNEPWMVKYVAQKIAEIRKQDIVEISSTTTENAIRLFELV